MISDKNMTVYQGKGKLRLDCKNRDETQLTLIVW